MAKQHRNSTTAWRVVGATLVAMILWGVVSLSAAFTWTLDVPVTIDLPPEEGLVRPVPRVLDLTVQANGWELAKMLATGRTSLVLRLPSHPGATEYTVRYGRRELLDNIRTNVPEARRVSIHPDTLSLHIGEVTTKRVPLRPAVTLNTRGGFQVMGQIRLQPDSVELRGAASALRDITRWETPTLRLDDVHKPVRTLVRLSDPSRDVITPVPSTATLIADVQEVAERSFTDVPVINRGTVRDTGLVLLLRPERVEVVVRGGARDLSRLDPSALVAYVNVLQGVDTAGVARPRLLSIPGFTVVRITPDRIRYVWRRHR